MHIAGTRRSNEKGSIDGVLRKRVQRTVAPPRLHEDVGGGPPRHGDRDAPGGNEPAPRSRPILAIVAPNVPVLPSRALACACLLGLTGAACRRTPVPPTPQQAHDVPATRGDSSETSGPTATSAGPWPPPSTDAPIVLVTDPRVLAHLTEFTFGRVAYGSAALRTDALAQEPGFSAIVKAIEDHLARIARSDPNAGVGIGHAHRLFDLRWLRDAEVWPELVGVSNRLDRQPFAPEHCGETRLLYRLRYAESRLPMTFNVVFWQGDPAKGDCGEVARRWHTSVGADPATLARALLEGPLAPAHLGPGRLKAVEFNLQTIRWPSVVHPSLAGHAEYLLMVFEPTDRGWQPSPLENTPDVARLRANSTLRAELLAWLLDEAQRAQLDLGTLVLPERFLATRSTSVTPRGLARLANRPFSQLFDNDDVAPFDGSGTVHLRSPAALLRRLDGLTCTGCHESRSVAGFHVLGDDPETQTLDALVTGLSPHLHADLARRQVFVATTADGGVVDPGRPLAEADTTPGGLHRRCGLGDPGFAAWTCEEGLTCEALDDHDLGICVSPDRPAGSPCEVGVLRSFPIGHQDRVRAVEPRPCRADAVCNTNRVGFPQGMCTASCNDLGPGEGCGTIVSLTPFNHCLGRKTPFPTCIANHGHPAGLAACDANRPCRDDYICARTPGGGGTCIPPYFLFQLRVDGHVLPGR